MQAVLKAQINKTDRNDARGIAQMMRVGLYRPVVTLRSHLPEAELGTWSPSGPVSLRSLRLHRTAAEVGCVG